MGLGEGSLALTVVELVGLSHHGHGDCAAIGLVEEALVGARLWEGSLPVAVEVEGIHQHQARQLVHSPFAKYVTDHAYRKTR